jgi:tRNA uridine 5-carboxymethylaminomethyl modification enzyme
MSQLSCEVLVIGGGHAGAEAAWAAANLGARTILVTQQRAAIGRMSCNPAIGGIGKGQIVREIDALGGLMGLVTDEAGIQFRMLNRGKGPAVWAPRAQADSQLYTTVLLRYLESCPNLTVIEAGVNEVLSTTLPTQGADRRISGAVLSDDRVIKTEAVVVAAGTFLRGLMHTGEERTSGGRIGEVPATELSDSLRSLGLTLGRLKTGTPPRLARDSVDLTRLQEQPGDPDPAPFSFMTPRITQSQVPCWLTATNPQVHALIRANLHRAPLYTGQIESTGPRYCPSIETKIVRFAEKDRHQIFLEPECRDGDRLYVNGLSTSLPKDVQQQMIALIDGLERARIVQWGYAIEYDFVPPEQTDATLMTKRVRGLFLAGQINGTSGYEEAAAQGIIAGINATQFAAGKPAVTIGRDEGYIGVLIDDVVTRGITEPYRMFTSRAEHRMHLRYDNADARLTPIGRQVGLVKDDRWAQFLRQRDRLSSLLETFDRLRWEGRTVRDWVKQPDEDGKRFLEPFAELQPYAAEREVWQRALVSVKYDGYIDRQRRMIAQFRELEDTQIPSATDYGGILHLRREAVERWTTVQPRSVGQAARVSGIHPTDVSLLLVYLSGRQSSVGDAQNRA